VTEGFAVAVIALAALSAARTLLGRSTALYLWMNDALELSPEQAPRAHATLAELTAAIDMPRPRLYVVPGKQPVAFAFRASGGAGIGLAEKAFDRLSPDELLGTIALLVAALAEAEPWTRARGPADWYELDETAAALTSRASVSAALVALALVQNDSSIESRLDLRRRLAAVNANVLTIVPGAPPVVARVAQLNDASAGRRLGPS
jgi:hypothetical protein